MKKINMSAKTNKVVKTVASVGGAVAAAGLAYVIGAEQEEITVLISSIWH